MLQWSLLRLWSLHSPKTNSKNKDTVERFLARRCCTFNQVNWTPKLSRDTLLEGRLPDIRLPLLVDDTKYCQVSLTDGRSTVEFGFHAKSVLSLCRHLTVVSLWLLCEINCRFYEGILFTNLLISEVS